MSIDKVNESVKAAIAIKAARTALGINQVEFAQLLGIAKTTLARIETLEMPVKLETYFNAIRLLKKLGVRVDITETDDIRIDISPLAQQRVVDKLADETKRRADRKKEK